MAERRMFAKAIVLSDAFLDMPMSARCLYFTLGMLADDDGFVGSPRSIMRQCGSTEDDLKILLAKRFVLGFESGVIVIKHWRMNNYLRNDRYIGTTYIEEKSTLKLDDKGAYTEQQNNLGIPTCNQWYPQDSIGKDSIDKDRLEKEIIKNTKEKATRFVPPTLEDVENYCNERNNNVDYVKWYNFYQSKGWLVGKNKMKDWKASVRTWERESNTITKNEVVDQPKLEVKEKKKLNVEILKWAGNYEKD